MKITLDLSKLVEEGKLTAVEAERLKSLAAPGTSALGISILIGFGVISIAASAVALVPVPATAIAIGIAVFAAGLVIAVMAAAQWHLLAQICLVIGALMFSGGVIAFGEGSLASLLIVTAALAVGSIVARSSLLMVGAVLALAGCLGARTGYMHASYSLAIYEPTVTIVLFGVLAIAAYQISKRLTADYEGIAIAAARTSVLLVNFGFWIGSLWGDPLRLLRSMAAGNLASGDPPVLNESLVRGAVIPAYVFSILWAAALLIVGVWGAKANRRWVVNVAAVFGAIHFYTQWFERLGANALSVLLGGLLMLGFGLALWTFNRRAETKKAS